VRMTRDGIAGDHENPRDMQSEAPLSPRFGEFLALGPHGFTQMGYTAWGPEDAERTVVCVHGLTRNSRDFDFLAQRFGALQMRVVAPDLPGRGRSARVEHAEDYGTPLYLAVMGALIAHLGVKEIDWVGTSLGGHIGMELAARPGNPIRRLVLNDFGARVPAAALQRIGNYLRNPRRFRTLAEVETYLREIYAPFGPLSDAHWRHLAQHSVIAESGQLRLNYDPKIVTQFSRPMFLDVALWRVWEHVECPVLILRGQNSDLLLPETVVEMKRRGLAAKQGRVESIEIPNCGHAPALMADAQIRVVEDFVLTDSVAGGARRRAAAGGRIQ
jgi:pimeloyl-ACP methyl ester carboxylesterase